MAGELGQPSQAAAQLSAYRSGKAPLRAPIPFEPDVQKCISYEIRTFNVIPWVPDSSRRWKICLWIVTFIFTPLTSSAKSEPNPHIKGIAYSRNRSSLLQLRHLEYLRQRLQVYYFLRSRDGNIWPMRKLIFSSNWELQPSQSPLVERALLSCSGKIFCRFSWDSRTPDRHDAMCESPTSKKISDQHTSVISMLLDSCM